MLREDRWQNLIEQFRTENFRLYQLSNQSVFAVSLQAGLSALKTTQCYRQSVDRNNECPVCHAALNKLAATLPFAHCSQSRLICHITGKPLGKTKFPYGSPLDPLWIPFGFPFGSPFGSPFKQIGSNFAICPLFAISLDLPYHWQTSG